MKPLFKEVKKFKSLTNALFFFFSLCFLLLFSGGNLLSQPKAPLNKFKPEPIVGEWFYMQGIYPLHTTHVDTLIKTGVKGIRAGITWNETEVNTKGNYDWKVADSMMKVKDLYNLKYIVTIGYGNGLYSASGGGQSVYCRSFDLSTDAEMNGYVTFLIAAMNRYKNKGIIWEIINEPDLFIYKNDPSGCRAALGNISDVQKGELYATLLKKIADQVRPLYPNEIMITGGVAFAGSAMVNAYIDKAATDLSFNAFDAFAFHEYNTAIEKYNPNNNTVSASWKLNTLNNQLVKNGYLNTVFINTETGGSGGDNTENSGYDNVWDGFDADGTLSDLQQAAYLPRTYLYGLSNSSSLYCYHMMQDMPRNSQGVVDNIRERYFGIVDTFYKRKPSFYALKTMLDQLQGYKLFANKSQGNTNDLVNYRMLNTHLTFTKNTDTTHVLWAVQDAMKIYNHSRSASFGIINGSYLVTSMLGDTVKEVIIKTNNATVTINEYPQYWKKLSQLEAVPSVPSALTASKITTTSCMLSWAASTDNVGVTAYEVYKNGVLMQTVANLQCNVTGLTEATSYSFTVKAKDAAGNISNASNNTAVTTLSSNATISSISVIADYEINIPTINAIETGRIQQYSSDGVASIIANPVSNMDNNSANVAKIDKAAATWALTGYNLPSEIDISSYNRLRLQIYGATITQLYVSLSNALNAKIADTLMTVSINNNWATIDIALPPTGLVNNIMIFPNPNEAVAKTYYIDNVSLVKVIDKVGPTTPTGLAVSAKTKTELTLSWNASTDAFGVKGYEVINGVTSLGIETGTSRVITGLSCGTAYSFTVIAYDRDDNPSLVSAALSTTTNICTDFIAPTAPSALAASNITATSVSLNWTAATDNVKVTQYDVYMDGKLLAGFISLPKRNVTGLACGKTYKFIVKARDFDGNVSDPSNEITVNTTLCPDITAPSIPTDLVSDLIDVNEFTVNWTASTDDRSAVTYDVYNGATLVGSTATTTYKVTGLAGKTSYTISIKAKDVAGNVSAKSADIVVTTLSGVGIASSNASGINIYPNPVSNGRFMIENVENPIVIISDISGKIIYKNSFTNQANNKLEIVLNTSQNNGLLLLQIIDKQQTYTSKLLLK